MEYIIVISFESSMQITESNWTKYRESKSFGPDEKVSDIIAYMNKNTSYAEINLLELPVSKKMNDGPNN